MKINWKGKKKVRRTRFERVPVSRSGLQLDTRRFRQSCLFKVTSCPMSRSLSLPSSRAWRVPDIPTSHDPDGLPL
jgi:hypothetical protein